MFSPVPDAPDAPLRARLRTPLLVLGGLVFAGSWLVVAAACNGRASWMTLIAPFNAIAWLRMAGTRPGSARVLLAAFSTAASIAFGEWLVAALPIAGLMNQSPLESAQRMGADFGWMLIRLGNTSLDWGLVVIALLLATRYGR